MKIEFTSTGYVDSFWNALDEVAKERKHLLFLEGPDKAGTTKFINDIIENNWTQFLAFDGNKIVGWCDITSRNQDGVRHVGHLGMGVIKSHRRKGLGERLIRISIEDAFSKEIRRIELEVFSSNTGAIALYEKVGFAVEGRKPKARYIDGIYDDIIIMGLMK